MPKSKIRHSKKGLLPKTMGGWAGFILKITGVVTIASPAIAGVTQFASDPAKIPNQIIYNYTGYSPTTGSFSSQQLLSGLTPIAVGTGLIFLGKYLGKVIR